MSEVQTETTQYEVKLPRPRTPKILVGAVVAVLFVAVVALAATALMNGAAQGQAEATAQVMPANTMLYFSLNTHTDKLPNFNVIADAWKDSKEANMLASGLEVAFTQSGLNWEEDVQPWLGERVAVGIVDLGGMDKTQANSPQYRAPFFVIAAQTKDHAKSNAFLTTLSTQLSKTSAKQTVQTESYRDIPLSYLASSGSTDNSVAWATVGDSIVLTLNPDNLKTIIDASLDGQNLSTSANYKTVMGSLPDQNAGALYMDFPAFMMGYMNMLTGVMNQTTTMLCELNTKDSSATPTPACAKLRQQADEQQQKMQAQMQQMNDMLQAIGGMGVAMTYEPAGIRFDMVAQYDPSKLPEKWQKYMKLNQAAVSNHIFGSVPASAILAANGNMQNAQWGIFLDPDYWAMSLSNLPGTSKDEIANKLAEFQKLVGVDLKTDLLDLFNGEAAFVMLPKAEQTKSEMGFSLPFQFAAMLDSSDAAKATSNLDKLVQGVSALAGKDSVKWQSLSGLPYSVVLDPNGKPMLTYGVVDGRLVIGTDSNTLTEIDNADQAPLSNNETFKQATGLLPGNRADTFFMNFTPLWNLVETASGGQDCKPCNYLKHFVWMSAGTESVNDGLQRSSLHIGIGQ